MHIQRLGCFWSASHKINKPVSLVWSFFGHYAMLAQGNQQYPCLKWVPDNSWLPSQLQFRQDFGVFPVMTVPGYFLFVLIRSCMLNEIMLFRDSKMHTNLYLVLFRMIHRVSPWFDPNEIVPILHVCSCADPAAPWSTQKTGVSPLCNRGSVGKWRCRDLMDGGDFVAWQMSEGLSSLLLWWGVGGTLPEAAVRGHCTWHGPLQAHGLSPGDTFSPVGSPVVLCRLQAPTCPPQAYCAWLLPHGPARWDWGWCWEIKNGFRCSMRNFRKMRHLVWGFAWALKIRVFVLEEIGWLTSKASTLVTLSAKWFLCLYGEHLTSWKVAVFLTESRTVYK